MLYLISKTVKNKLFVIPDSFSFSSCAVGRTHYCSWDVRSEPVHTPANAHTGTKWCSDSNHSHCIGPQQDSYKSLSKFQRAVWGQNWKAFCSQSHWETLPYQHKWQDCRAERSCLWTRHQGIVNNLVYYRGGAWRSLRCACKPLWLDLAMLSWLAVTATWPWAQSQASQHPGKHCTDKQWGKCWGGSKPSNGT